MVHAIIFIISAWYNSAIAVVSGDSSRSLAVYVHIAQWLGSKGMTSHWLLVKFRLPVAQMHSALHSSPF